MSYSNSFPQQRPTLNLDFANSGKLDSRISFSRADTPPTYAAPSAVHYWSNEKSLNSENLLTYSNPNDAAWTEGGLTVTTDQTTSPDGTSNASALTEDSSTGIHRTFFSTPVNSGDSLTVVGYLKANGRSVVQVGQTGTYGTSIWVEFDLSGSGSSVTRFGSPTNVSIAQVGSTGWYKISYSSTTTSSGTHYTQLRLCDAADSPSYTGDGTSGIYAYGLNLSSNGQLVTDATSGQIHREFASTLKSVANAGDPRFEYDPTDGQSEGLLIEQQFTQLVQYSEELDNSGGWSIANATVQPNSAVSPDGTLSADLLVESHDGASSNYHYIYQQPLSSVSVGQTYTATIYAKAAGRNHVTIWTNIGGASSTGTFDLTDGSVTSSSGSGSFSSTDCGNGWYRLQLTFTTVTNAVSSLNFYTSNGVSHSYTGNGYGSVILWGANLTETASSMSYLKAEGSQTTKSADSCSVVSAPLLDNGSGGLVAEYNMFAASDTSYVLHLNKTSGGTNGDGVAITNQYLYVENNYLNIGNTSSNVFHKVAASWESGSQKASRDGSAVAENTSTVVPSGIDKLYIGQRQDGGEPVNGHIRNISIYSEPLTSTNLTTLSQL